MTDMEKTYTSEELAAIAEQTAHEVGAEVLRWWQNKSEPCEFYIDATLKSKNITLLLVTILPGERDA